MTGSITPLDRLPDRDAFDRIVGSTIAADLVELQAIEQALSGEAQEDSVAAMTARMQLEDERDALHARVARALLACRMAAGG